MEDITPNADAEGQYHTLHVLAQLLLGTATPHSIYTKLIILNICAWVFPVFHRSRAGPGNEGIYTSIAYPECIATACTVSVH